MGRPADGKSEDDAKSVTIHAYKTNWKSGAVQYFGQWLLK